MQRNTWARIRSSVEWTVLAWGNDPVEVLPTSSINAPEALGAKLVALAPETQREWAEDNLRERVLVLGDHTVA